MLDFGFTVVLFFVTLKQKPRKRFTTELPQIQNKKPKKPGLRSVPDLNGWVQICIKLSLAGN